MKKIVVCLLAIVEECLVLCCVIAHCVGRDSHDHHHCQNHHLLHNRVSYILKYWCPIINNVKVEKGDILQLDYPDESFDKVVAANVIHLLDTPPATLLCLQNIESPEDVILVHRILTIGCKVLKST